jgi:hypothetical protein
LRAGSAHSYRARISGPALTVSGCFGEGGTQQIDDKLDTPLVVPKDGTYQ